MSARVNQLPGGHAPADAGGSAGGVSSLNLWIYWPIDAGKQAALGALGRKVFMTAGFDPATGRVVEVFLRGGSKHGDRIDFALDQLAIDISRRIQAGTSLFELLTTLALYELSEHLVADDQRGAPRFPIVLVIEAILHRLVQIECWASQEQ